MFRYCSMTLHLMKMVLKMLANKTAEVTSEYSNAEVLIAGDLNT